MEDAARRANHFDVSKQLAADQAHAAGWAEVLAALDITQECEVALCHALRTPWAIGTRERAIRHAAIIAAGIGTARTPIAEPAGGRGWSTARDLEVCGTCGGQRLSDHAKGEVAPLPLGEAAQAVRQEVALEPTSCEPTSSGA
eukprot:scaffold24734_cov61-Phaeocystis_antarctica.AAC.5